MGDSTGIEWTDATVNFWWGCTRVGPGCDHCYADSWALRYGESLWGAGVPRRKIKSALKTLYRLDNDYSWWAADAEIGQLHPNSRRRVFIQSMADLFDKEVPLEWFDEAWTGITACNRLDIQIVTKRISLVEKRLNGKPWPQHAGLIISVVNQAEADRDIPRLLSLKARLGIPWVGLSMEPLLGPVVLRSEWLRELDWIIVGGESGPHARPMHPYWARSLRDQCAGAGVPFFFKQWGECCQLRSDLIPVPARHIGWVARDGRYKFNVSETDCRAMTRDDDKHDCVWWSQVVRVGKKRAGRLLDGVEHNGVPA